MRNRDEIFEDIQAERPFILRHEITPRIWKVMDELLDEIVEIQKVEAASFIAEFGVVDE